MTWVRTDDAMPLHPKILRLSDGAFRLWENGLHFANRSVSDGRIDKSLIPTLNHHGRWTARQLSGFVSELVGGLWVDHGDHYAIHEYAHYQAEAMKDRVERNREYERDRKRKAREGSDRKRHRVPTNVPAGHGAVSGADSSVPTRPDPSRPEESANALSAREAVRRFDEAARAKPPTQPDHLDLAEVATVFSETRKAAGGGVYKNYNRKDDGHLSAIAAAANESGTTRIERMAALVRMVSAFCADTNARAEGCPVGWLARDPGRYLSATAKDAPKPISAARQRLADATKAYEADKECPDALEALREARRALNAEMGAA